MFPKTPPARPPINLGEISGRLGFSVSRVFIEGELGITPTKIVKSAVYWPESAWAVICDALIAHITTKKGSH